MREITIIKRLLFLFTVCMLTACGAPKNFLQLEDAQAFYDKVSRDPIVARNAALELENARQSLKKARTHWEEGSDKSIVEHYAYMTDQNIAIAQYRAQLIENEGHLSSLALEHQQAQLTANQQENADSRNIAKLENRETQSMMVRVARLQREVKELQARQTDRGLVLTLGHELFEYENAGMTPEAVAKVGKVAGFVNEYPEQNVLIEGHTDTLGDESYNQELSARRAEAVKLALVMKGVKEERVVTRGLGESSPRNPKVSGLARVSNHRVEIIFAKDAKPQETHQLSYYQMR